MTNTSAVISSDWLALGVLVLLLVSGWWAWRWSRSDVGRRWAFDAFMLLLLSWQWTYWLLTTSSTSGWRRAFVVLYPVVLAISGWQCARNFGRWWRSRVSSRPASLKSQLVLILLPVTVLAIAGMISLAHDRAAVQDAARRRAEELSRELADKLSESLPSELVRLEQAGDEWNGIGVGLTLARPVGSAPLRLAALSADWRERYPLPPADVLPISLRFNADGILLDPTPYPAVPVPNPWSARLSGKTAEAWGDIVRLHSQDAEPTVLDSAVRAFERLSDDATCRHELALLRLLRETNRFHREDGLLGLAESAAVQQIIGEAGLPLGIAALAAALRDASNRSLDDAWARPVAELTLTQPSSLTPWVLDRAEELARRASDVGRLVWVTELRARWASAERRRGLAAAVRARVPLSAALLTNAWVEHGGTHWLAVVQPGTNKAVTASAGRWGTNSLPGILCRVLREDQVGWAIHHAASAGVIRGQELRRGFPPSVPAGLKIGVTMEGRAVPLPKSEWATSDPENAGVVLAVAEREFSTPAELIRGLQPLVSWPSRPKFTVRVHLADSAALFAAQRRQQWFFGGMILATAAIAGFGAWQVNRAFRRQLALNAEKSNFVASVSHELRTPLASARLLAEGLASGRIEEEAKRHEYAGFLVQETRRLGALVENVLDFARIEQGRKQYQFEPTDLGRLVTATVRLFEPLAAERQVRLELHLPSGSAQPGASLELNADGAALQQALVNLLDNALKHAPADSAVTVTLEDASARRTADGPARAPSGWFRLSVSDAGPGIPPEDHERIFERFFRRGSELRRETQGVGLGLAIVKHIVAAHGGRVWVESQPGQGARFVVELPVRESDQCSLAGNQSAGRNDR